MNEMSKAITIPEQGSRGPELHFRVRVVFWYLLKAKFQGIGSLWNVGGRIYWSHIFNSQFEDFQTFIIERLVILTPLGYWCLPFHSVVSFEVSIISTSENFALPFSVRFSLEYLWKRYFIYLLLQRCCLLALSLFCIVQVP